MNVKEELSQIIHIIMIQMEIKLLACEKSVEKFTILRRKMVVGL